MYLLKMECKKIAGSILYWLFVLALAMVCVSGYDRKVEAELARTEDPNSVFYAIGKSVELPMAQKRSAGSHCGGLEDVAEAAQPQAENPAGIAPDVNYGGRKNDISREEREQNMMEGAVDRLLNSYRNNQYEYYPFGYIKIKTMSEQEQAVICEYLMELTGLSEQELAAETGDEGNDGSGGQSGGGEDVHMNDISVSGKGAWVLAPGKGEINAEGQFIAQPEDWQYRENDGNSPAAAEEEDGGYSVQVSFDRFKEIMSGINQMIGRNSYFSWGMLTLYYLENDMEDAPVTEQQHLEFFENDRVTGAFARYYCDSISTVLLFLPGFLMIDLMMKDKRHHMRELIYPKRISSARLIGIRYLASVCMAMIPILILPVKSQISLTAYCRTAGIRTDAFAFIKYILAWILPTVLFIMAVSLFAAVLSESYFAVLFIGFIWLAGRPSIDKIAGGNYGLFDLIIRHNTLKGYGRMMENIRSLTANRLFITAIALGFVMLSVFVYDTKRRGKITFGSREFFRGIGNSAGFSMAQKCYAGWHSGGLKDVAEAARRRRTIPQTWFFFTITKFNIRLIYKRIFPLAAAVLSLIPLIYGVSNLDGGRSADCLERMAVLVGIPMFVPLIKPEQQEGMAAVITLRLFSYRRVVALRTGISLAGTMLLILAFELSMRIHGCTFPFFSYAVRTLLAAMLIGLPGLLASILVKNTTAGFFISFCIYGISQTVMPAGIVRIVSNGVSFCHAAVLAGLISAVIILASKVLNEG